MANIVTARELSDYLKLSESTVYKLASTGELPGFRIGDSWRFDMDEVLEQIKRRRKVARERSVSAEDQAKFHRRKEGGAG